MEEEKKRKLEEEQRKQDAERLQGLEARHADLALKFQQQQQQIDSLSQERGSQQRQQQADDLVALDSTVPVDEIIENTNCELHSKMKNISMKMADGVAFPVSPEYGSTTSSTMTRA